MNKYRQITVHTVLQSNLSLNIFCSSQYTDIQIYIRLIYFSLFNVSFHPLVTFSLKRDLGAWAQTRSADRSPRQQKKETLNLDFQWERSADLDRLCSYETSYNRGGIVYCLVRRDFILLSVPLPAPLSIY